MSAVDDDLLALLVCPKCRQPLRASATSEGRVRSPSDQEQSAEAEELVCTGAQCALAYPVRDGIPVLLVDEARPAGNVG